MFDVKTWELAEPGPSRWQELKRRVVRFRREVPAIAQLRAAGATIGERVTMEAGVRVDPGFAWLVSIGDDVGISIDVMILAHDASSQWGIETTYMAPVTIGSHVFIGARTIFLPGTTVGDHCVIGAGAVLRGDYPSGSVIVGVPGRVVGETDAYHERHLEQARKAPRWTYEEVTSPDVTLAQRAEMLATLRAHGFGYIGQTELPERITRRDG